MTLCIWLSFVLTFCYLSIYIFAILYFVTFYMTVFAATWHSHHPETITMLKSEHHHPEISVEKVKDLENNIKQTLKTNLENNIALE